MTNEGLADDAPAVDDEEQDAALPDPDLPAEAPDPKNDEVVDTEEDAP